MQRQDFQVFIRPYDGRHGVCNASATATDTVGATLRGTAAFSGTGQLIGRGTGLGSHSIISYSPMSHYHPRCSRGGPGTLASEVLLHELVHSIRHMAGRFVLPENVPGAPLMGNTEEFVAVLVTNIYRSEMGLPGLRSDHAAGLLAAPLTDPAVFRARFRQQIANFQIENRRFVELLRTVRCPFNPLRA
jgi:hypothetical protein